MTKLVSVTDKLIESEHKFVTPSWNSIPYTVEDIINMGFSRLSILEAMRLYHEINQTYNIR